MAEKEPPQPTQPPEPPPTARQVKKDFALDAERLLGVDDATLKSRQPVAPGTPLTEKDRVRAEKARRTTQSRREDLAGQRGLREWWQGVVQFLFAIFNPEARDTRSASRGRALAMVVAVLVIAIGAYLLAERPSMTRTVGDLLGGRQSGQSAQGASAGGTTKASTTQGEAQAKRWLITRVDNSRPQFTIELRGDGPSGPAVWLEPPQGTGTYSWSGDQLKVKLVLKDHKAGEGVYFDQHFELDMTQLADGGLTGTMSAEDWRYSLDTGLELLGMKPCEAIGEPK